MHVLWLILKGTGLFIAACIAVASGASLGQPKTIKEANKGGEILLPILFPFVYGALAVVAWILSLMNGWGIMGISAAAGLLIGYAAEKFCWSRMTSEKSEAWLSQKNQEEKERIREREEEQKTRVAKARTVAERLAKEREQQEQDEQRWLPVIKSLESKTLEECSPLVLKVPFEHATGGTAFGSKVVAGILTGGVGAVREDKFTLDTVQLPEICCLCGLFPGSVEKWSSCHFQLGSALAGLVGVNLAAQLTINYKVCSRCGPRSETAIQLSGFTQKGEVWQASLKILNPEVARRITDLNQSALVATTPAGG